jgi:hypothetical protein
MGENGFVQEDLRQGVSKVRLLTEDEQQCL